MDLPPFMISSEYILPLTCLSAVLLTSLVIIFVVCFRQRRKIAKLEQQLVEVEKHIESTLEQKAPIEGLQEVITSKESPASQVWESDECVFYDLGSISRGVSRDVLDQIEATNEPHPAPCTQNSNDTEDNSSGQDRQETKPLAERTPVTIRIDSIESGVNDERDLGIDEKLGSVKSLQDDSKLDSGSLEELTDEIWVGDASKGESNEKLSINDALSDISENGGMEDSGNETISNDDMLCPSVEMDERGEDDDGGKGGGGEIVKVKEEDVGVGREEEEEALGDEIKA